MSSESALARQNEAEASGKPEECEAHGWYPDSECPYCRIDVLTEDLHEARAVEAQMSNAYRILYIEGDNAIDLMRHSRDFILDMLDGDDPTPIIVQRLDAQIDRLEKVLYDD